MNDEDHFVTDPTMFRTILWPLVFSGHKVLEIGVGHGELTSMILEKNPKSVVGYEIVEDRCHLQDPRFTLVEGDITKVDLSVYADYGLVCNPPYSLLPFIRENLLNRFKIRNSMLMVSPKYQSMFSDHLPLAIIDGAAFTPVSKGQHVVLVQGF